MQLDPLSLSSGQDDTEAFDDQREEREAHIKTPRVRRP
jgi:hypothetical protein